MEGVSINGQQYGNGYLQFHMNWGWDGNSNGWYGFDSWAPTGTGLNFQYYKRAIINLHPLILHKAAALAHRMSWDLNSQG